MKKLLAILLALVMVVPVLAACNKEDGKYTIGVCQLMTHDALDAATKGFMDAVKADLG